MRRMYLALVLVLGLLSGGAPVPGRAVPVRTDLAMAVLDPGVAVPLLSDTHEEGWTWAKSQDVADVEACQGHGPHFAAGCQDYIAAELRTRDDQLAAGFSRP